MFIQPVTCSLKGISFEQQHQQFLWLHVQSLLSHYYNNIPAGISSCPNPTHSCKYLHPYTNAHQPHATGCHAVYGENFKYTGSAYLYYQLPLYLVIC